ncbi:MAG: S8 family serine peptidase [Thiolinea sp.]
MPAAADSIIAVGALGRLGDMNSSIEEPRASTLLVTSFSNYNANLSAPGLKVLSAYPGNTYRKLNGTSMATPHVAGIAALWVEKQLGSFGKVDTAMLQQQLLGSASLSGLLYRDAQLGIDMTDTGIGLAQAPQ